MADGDDDETTGGRRYGGRSTAERRAERRDHLREAALEIVATRGWAAATMTEVCRVAGLTERYFYESFGSREELYAGLIEDLDRELREAAFDAVAAEDLAPAERLEATTRAIVALYVSDPRRGRATLIEGIGVRALEEQRRRSIAGLFDLLAERWELFFPGVDVGPDERRLRATAIGGATIAVVTARLEGEVAIDDAALVRSMVATARAIAGA